MAASVKFAATPPDDANGSGNTKGAGRHSPCYVPVHGGQSAALSYLSAASTLGEDPDTLARLVTDCTFVAPTRQEAAALPSRVGVCPTTFTFAQQSTIGQSTHPGVVRFLADRQREHEEGEEGKEVEMEGRQEGEGEGEEAVRPLGGFERLFATYQSMGLGLIFFIADINGPVDAELLQRAMRMAVKRHPNLRSVLVQGGLKAIPLSRCPKVTVARVESDDAVAWTEAHLNNSIRIKQGNALYLWSLHLHHTPATGVNQLVFLIHHALSDGDSVNQLLQELVENVSRQALVRQASRSRLVLEQSVLPQLPSADSQLRLKLRGVKVGCLSFAGAMWTTVKRSISPGRVPVPVERRKFHERGTGISSFVVEPPEMKRILLACKAHGTTLTGALTAACAQEMEGVINKHDGEAKARSKAGGGKRGKTLLALMKWAATAPSKALRGAGGGGGAGQEYMVRVDVLVNFRKKAAAPSPSPDDADGAEAHPGPGGAAAETAALADKAHQLYAAPVDIMLRAGSTPATRIRFWEAATQVRKEIVSFLDEPHQIIDCLGVMNTLGGVLGQRKLKSLADGPLQGRSRALSISNLGVTDGLFTSTPAGVSVGRTQWGIDEGFVGHSIFLAVASYRGCLNCTISYSPSIFTREMAVAFGEGIQARLMAAAAGEGVVA